MGGGMTDDQIASCWPTQFGLPQKQEAKLLRFARAVLDMSAGLQTWCARPGCVGIMRIGHALQNTHVGTPDFPGSEVVTMSPGGPGNLLPCLKCSACGYSVTT